MKKFVAIVTEYRPGSHADVLLTKFLKGFPLDDAAVDTPHAPRIQLAGIYLDQVHQYLCLELWEFTGRIRRPQVSALPSSSLD